MAHHYRLELPAETRRLPNIRLVQIQTHSRCNADCLFCPWVESEHHDKPGVMTNATWNLILDQLAPFPLAKVCPYLMQEPLIDRTIFAKIADIYRRFPWVLVEVSTNGMALTDKVTDKLFEVFFGKNHDLWVSHHGIDKATYEHIMALPYERATENLLNLIRKSDGRHVIKIRGAGQSRDGKHCYFTPQQYKDYWTGLAAKHSLNVRNVSVDAFTFHDRAGTLLRKDRGACELNVGKIRDIGPGHQPFHCCRVDEWLHFMWDGRIRLCCMDYHGEVELPNIKDVSLTDYFMGPEYARLVGMVSGRIESPDDFICKRCISPGG